MKRYICLLDHKSSGPIDGTLTKGKIYRIKHDPDRKRSHMYIIDCYDGEKKPGPLNDWWFEKGFKLAKIELSKHIRIL